IVSYIGHGPVAWFEVLWQSGDRTWLPHGKVKHLATFDAYLENIGMDGIDHLPRGTGKPPRDILDQVEHAENVIESDLELNYAFVSKTGGYKNERTETHTWYFSKTNQHMSDSTDPALIVRYYEYASQLVDAALINGPNPGPPPQAYTAWASANSKPRSIAEARNKLSRPSATFTDPNGNVQWVGQHPIPAAGPPTPGPYVYPYAPYQPYAAPSLSSAHTGLMTPLEHLSYLGKIRDYEREVTWEAGHRTYSEQSLAKRWQETSAIRQVSGEVQGKA
ncbi:hypothetical protein JB92DRAFT_3265444, partial [Gautieria morchelliformis]